VEFSLGQNYPNPFNPSTRIQYAVPSEGLVSIKVYDIFGREVAALVNEKRQRGYYEVEWTARTLSSGVYYYRLVVQGAEGQVRRELKKMILMK
jgi:hypothetical protein